MGPTLPYDGPPRLTAPALADPLSRKRANDAFKRNSPRGNSNFSLGNYSPPPSPAYTRALYWPRPPREQAEIQDACGPSAETGGGARQRRGDVESSTPARTPSYREIGQMASESSGASGGAPGPQVTLLPHRPTADHTALQTPTGHALTMIPARMNSSPPFPASFSISLGRCRDHGERYQAVPAPSAAPRRARAAAPARRQRSRASARSFLPGLRSTWRRGGGLIAHHAAPLPLEGRSRRPDRVDPDSCAGDHPGHQCCLANVMRHGPGRCQSVKSDPCPVYLSAIYVYANALQQSKRL